MQAEYVLYYIAQEALFNAYKHAQAGSVTITMRFTTSAVHLVVGDDGIGIDEQHLNLGTEPVEGTMAHFGLRNMRARAQELGGKLGIVRPRRGGTEVRVTIPIRAASSYV